MSVFLVGGAWGQTADPGADNGGAFLAVAQDPATTYDHLEKYVLPMNAQQLSELADIWQGHVQAVIRENVDANLRLETAEEPEASGIRDQLVDITRRQIQQNAKYSLVLDTWKRRGGTEDEMSKHLAFEAALTAEVLQQSETETVLQILWTWLTSSSGLIEFLWTIAAIVAVFAGVLAFATFVRLLAERTLAHIAGLSKSQRKLLGSLAFWLTFVIGILVSSGLLGFSVSGLFALVGGVSLILGLALQESIGNLANGLMLILLKPVDIGDYVIAADTEGTVEDIGLMATKIRAFDNSLVIIPNGKFWSDTIRNVEANRVRRVEYTFTAANMNDFASIKTALNKLAADNPNCLPKPAPTVYVSHLDENVMTIVFWVWVKTADYWSTYTELSERIQELFNATMMLEPVQKADVRIIETSHE